MENQPGWRGWIFYTGSEDLMADNITWEEAVLWLRDQPEQQELVRACYYDDPLIEAAMRYEASEEWQAARLLLPEKVGFALDVGAGRGISSYALAKAGWQVDALEPDASMVVGRGAIQKLADESNAPINPVNGYAENIPVEDEKYDLVYGRQVMHHAQNLQKMCDEIMRVLKPGGTFIATREHVISKKEDLPVFLEQHALHSLYGGENAFLLEEYIQSLKKSGLRIIRALGPFDTAINYFPVTQNVWQEQVQRSLTKRMGKKVVQMLLPNTGFWTKTVNQLLASFMTSHDQSAGRLYTFIAKKR